MWPARGDERNRTGGPAQQDWSAFAPRNASWLIARLAQLAAE
jgi:hypothetical protein